MVNLIFISNGVCSDVLNPAIKPVVDLSIGLCFARLHIFAHFLHTRMAGQRLQSIALYANNAVCANMNLAIMRMNLRFFALFGFDE